MADVGFAPATRRKVFQALEGVKRLESCPFVNLPEKRGRHKFDLKKMAKTTWIKPEVVVEIAMNEWTPDWHLRHSEFLRLRPEKRSSEVDPFPVA